jgi:16S rRNA processing protein RimM
MGLNVFNREGVALGVVRDLLATGPQTVLVIEYTESIDSLEKIQERMIPFVSHFVDDVNLAEKRITVDWQPDY